jgi:enoyl-CoA hydratase/carnithine racemase
MPEILVRRDADPGIATVVLSNPDKLNAINLAMWQQLTAAMNELSADSTLRCIVIRGDGGKAFAAGGDIEEFLACRDTHERAYAYHEGAVAPALGAIADCPLPTVALIEGACIGGGLEIACCCDLRIAGESASFGAPILKLGFSMYPGEMIRVLSVARPAVAAEILLEGRILSAAEAMERGLLTRVVADSEVESEALAAARRIAQGAPLVARWHKQWMRRLADPAPLGDAEKRSAFAFLDTDDYREGLAAFLGKRRPDFRGR